MPTATVQHPDIFLPQEPCSRASSSSHRQVLLPAPLLQCTGRWAGAPRQLKAKGAALASEGGDLGHQGAPGAWRSEAAARLRGALRTAAVAERGAEAQHCGHGGLSENQVSGLDRLQRGPGRQGREAQGRPWGQEGAGGQGESSPAGWRGQKGWQEQKGGRAHIWDSHWVWRLVGGPQLQVVAPEDMPPGEGSGAGEQTAPGDPGGECSGADDVGAAQRQEQAVGRPLARSL